MAILFLFSEAGTLTYVVAVRSLSILEGFWGLDGLVLFGTPNPPFIYTMPEIITETPYIKELIKLQIRLFFKKI